VLDRKLSPETERRQHRARRLVRLNAERRALEAELERHGGMAGPVRPAQRPASWALDRIAAEEHATWAA